MDALDIKLLTTYPARCREKRRQSHPHEPSGRRFPSKLSIDYMISPSVDFRLEFRLAVSPARLCGRGSGTRKPCHLAMTEGYIIKCWENYSVSRPARDRETDGAGCLSSVGHFPSYRKGLWHVSYVENVYFALRSAPKVPTLTFNPCSTTSKLDR